MNRFLRLSTSGLLVSVLVLQACTSAPETETEVVNDISSSGAAYSMGDASVTSGFSIVENAGQQPVLSTLMIALQATGLDATLSGTGPFTVFAPTNTAFNKLPAGAVPTLLKPENEVKLMGLLTYHIVSGIHTVPGLQDGMILRSMQGSDLRVTLKDGKVFINDTAIIETADIVSGNGVIHIIDSVIPAQ